MSASALVAFEEGPKAPVEVEAENFTVIAGEGQECIADVIFLHGLQGHPKNTWTFGRTQDEKERGKLAKILHLKPKTANTVASTSCFWPEDLLPVDFKDVRILTYGYDSHVSHFFEGGASQATIPALGRSFLNDLEGIRRDQPARPIIFVVHSLGGLVLKDALRRSWRADASEADLKTVYDSTKAIIFMGTPHRGSDYAPWGIIARNIAVAAGFDANARLLKDLRADSTMLDLLRDEFGKMLREEKFRVYTFSEGKGLKGVQGLTTKVVGDESSALNDGKERRDIINANHMEMCRFSGAKDSGYRKVKNALAQCLTLLRTIPNETPTQINVFSKEADDALAALDDGETRIRFDTVEEAYEDTFNWVFEKPELQLENWLREGTGLYWIQGKPASGKSTLMKKIYKDPRTARCLSYGEGEKARAAFFFHDRGSEKQRSLEGLLQAIIFQIIKAIPSLFPYWLSCYTKWKTSPNIVALNEAFSAILKQKEAKVNLCLFLDALDEYSGKNKDLSIFLKNIVHDSSLAWTKLKVIFSSRPSQVFLDEFDASHVPRFQLQDHTANDINVVIDTKMRANVRMLQHMNSLDHTTRTLTQKFAFEVASRAEGVFIWVKLVLDELLEEFSTGDSIKRTLKSPLDRLYDDLLLLPKDLEAYYERMLLRIPLRYREEAHIMLEVVKCANKPLTAHEFVEACRIATMSDLRQWSPSESRRDDIERLIRTRLGSLVELVRVDTTDTSLQYREDEHAFNIPYRVQFIHQTVKSWMQKSLAPRTLLKEEYGNDTGHVYIVKYLVASVIKACESPSRLISEATLAASDNVSWRQWIICPDLLYHAHHAESSTGQSQSATLSQLTDANIQYVFDNPMWIGEMQYPPIEGVLSFAVAAGLSIFLHQTLYVANVNQPLTISLLHLLVEISDGQPDFTLDISGTTKLKILRILLDANARLDSRWKDKTPFQLLCTQRENETKTEMICCFLEHGQDPEVPFTYREKMSKRKWATRTGRPLHHAARTQDEGAVKALIQYGASVNPLDSLDRTPLDYLYRHLGNQIADFLASYPNLSEKARSLPQRLRIITFLLDQGAKGALAPSYDEPIYVAYHFDDEAPITKDMIDALKKQGLSADYRLVDIPRIQPSLLARTLGVLGRLTSSMANKWHASDYEDVT